jgi:thiol-disulfide isomerase/thioredoxin
LTSVSLATASFVAASFLLVACGSADSMIEVVPGTSAADGAPEPVASQLGPGLELRSQAPAFVGLEGWVNSDPLSIAELNDANRVVLVDFWTYTCINCIRTLPFLSAWYDKYRDFGLTIVGVHAPEFDFEADRDNVVMAVERYGLTYPVAQDNEMQTWTAFNNYFWPAKYLIGADGRVRYQHFGEGSYEETERAIREALTAAGYEVGSIPLGGVEAPRLDPHATAITRELYGGYDRNYRSSGIYAAQAGYYEAPDRTREYTDVAPGIERSHNQWYLHGLWLNERESIQHARATEELQDYVALRFVGRSVNVVLGAASDEPYLVVVEIDGRPLTNAEAGADIVFDETGRSILRVDEARMYAVVELPMLGDRELRLLTTSSDFALFAVTFGAYTSGG